MIVTNTKARCMNLYLHFTPGAAASVRGSIDDIDPTTNNFIFSPPQETHSRFHSPFLSPVLSESSHLASFPHGTQLLDSNTAGLSDPALTLNYESFISKLKHNHPSPGFGQPASNNVFDSQPQSRNDVITSSILPGQGIYGISHQALPFANESPMQLGNIQNTIGPHHLKYDLQARSPVQVAHQASKSALQPLKPGILLDSTSEPPIKDTAGYVAFTGRPPDAQESAVQRAEKAVDLTRVIDVANEIMGEGAHSVVYLGDWGGKKSTRCYVILVRAEVYSGCSKSSTCYGTSKTQMGASKF